MLEARQVHTWRPCVGVLAAPSAEVPAHDSAKLALGQAAYCHTPAGAPAEPSQPPEPGAVMTLYLLKMLIVVLSH